MYIRKSIASLAALVLLGISVNGFAEEGSKTNTFKLDPAHTQALFKASHMGISYTFGRFNDVSGHFKFNESNPEKNSVKLTIDTTSIDTNHKKRDKHLRSPDFFNAKQFPKMTFKSSNFEKTGDDTYEVTGDLTLHGKTKEISFDVKHVGSGKGPKKNFRRGFYAEFQLDRTQFGVDYMPKALGKEVTVMVSAEGIKK